MMTESELRVWAASRSGLGGELAVAVLGLMEDRERLLELLGSLSQREVELKLLVEGLSERVAAQSEQVYCGRVMELVRRYAVDPAAVRELCGPIRVPWLDEILAERERLRALVASLSERVFEQSELLSRRSEVCDAEGSEGESAVGGVPACVPEAAGGGRDGGDAGVAAAVYGQPGVVSRADVEAGAGPRGELRPAEEGGGRGAGGAEGGGCICGNPWCRFGE